MKPTLSELEKFEEQPEGTDLELTELSQEDQGHNFATGDNVEVCQGELSHLQGKMISMDGNKITIMPKHEDLKVRFTLLSHCPFICRLQNSILFLNVLGSIGFPSSRIAQVFQNGRSC